MSTEALTVAAPAGVAWMEPSREQVDLLKRTIARGTSDDEFRLFLEACRRRRFDPFSKLIYPVKRYDSQSRGEVMALQSSIDSFRLVAERTGKYEGQVGPLWCGEDGVWKDVWLSPNAPAAAKVGVWRSGFKEPLWGVALWTNTVQTTREGKVTKFWAQMGPLMLAKCAESQALRRAFPEDLAGLYTSEEMMQAEKAEVEVVDPPKAQPVRTLEQAAERAPAPVRQVTAEVVQPKPSRPASAQAATEPAKPSGGKQPDPAKTGGGPVLEKAPNGYRYWGCFIDEKVVDNYNRWKGYQVESKKDKYVNGKPWHEMPFGAKGGGREGWLSSVATWCAGLQDSENKSNALGERAAYSLFLMHDRFYREEQERVLNSEFEERTGIHIDPSGTSVDALPFTDAADGSAPF